MREFIVVLLVMVSVHLMAQTVVLSEDFNDGFPAGWQLIDGDGLTPNSSPAVNFIDDAFVVVEDYDSTGIGDSVLIATSWFQDESGEADDYLILPSITMGGYGNYISFDARSIDAAHPNELEIRISTNGVDLWRFFEYDALYRNDYVNSTWTNYTVSLDSAVNVYNTPVFIAIRHKGIDDYILAIDNIKVFVDDPVSVNQGLSSDEFQVYPNPSNGIMTLSGIEFTDGLGYELRDIAGKIVSIGTLISNSLDFSRSVEVGTYILTVEGYSPYKLQIQ